MLVDNVNVTSIGFKITKSEARHCIELAKLHTDDTITEITVEKIDNGYNVHWKAQGKKFERIRRITGYLSGDIRGWNNAKQSEERERVKHFGDNYAD